MTDKYIKAVFLLIPILFIAVCLSCAFGIADQADAKIGGFRFYITDDDGKKKGVINGLKADFISSDEIEITDAVAEITDIGKHPVIINTPKCTFVKSSSSIVSDLPIIIQTLGIEINGTGMNWTLEDKKITVLKDVIVDVLKNVQEKYNE